MILPLPVKWIESSAPEREWWSKKKSLYPVRIHLPVTSAHAYPRRVLLLCNPF